MYWINIYFQKYIGSHTVSVISMKLIYYSYCLLHKQAVGMALGAACYFDYNCICCVVMYGKFYVY